MKLFHRNISWESEAVEKVWKLYFSILITWPIYSYNGCDGIAAFDAAITVSCKDQQKMTSVQVDCTADVHRVVVWYHRNTSTAQSISNGIWSKLKIPNCNLQNSMIRFFPSNPINTVNGIVYVIKFIFDYYFGSLKIESIL